VLSGWQEVIDMNDEELMELADEDIVEAEPSAAKTRSTPPPLPMMRKPHPSVRAPEPKLPAPSYPQWYDDQSAA
jgi:hypothetical protein